MSKEKSKLLYYKSIIRKERLIEGLKTLKNEEYRLELLELYVIYFHLVGIYELGIEDIDKLLLRLSKEKRHYITYHESDYLYLKDYGKKELLISMFYTRKKEDAKEMVLTTGIYDDSILWNIKVLFGLEPLVELYKKTKDNDILAIAYGYDDAIELYKKFLPYIDDEWTEKYIGKISKECKISDILKEHKIFSKENLIKMWHSLYNTLTSEDVYDIFRTSSYNESDIKTLCDVLCKEKNPYYLCLILVCEIGDRDIRFGDLTELIQTEIKRLEKALRDTKNIEYNLYYDYYKNKDKLIEKFGSKINLVAYLNKNSKQFTNSYEYAIVKKKLESEMLQDAENQINEDEINSFLFRDSDDVKQNEENSKKMVKKDKKDKK